MAELHEEYFALADHLEHEDANEDQGKEVGGKGDAGAAKKVVAGDRKGHAENGQVPEILEVVEGDRQDDDAEGNGQQVLVVRSGGVPDEQKEGSNAEDEK